MSSPSSSARSARQSLADQLAALRADAGLTGRELSRRAGWHESKTSRIERARRSPTEDDIRSWCRVCGTDERAGDLIAALRDTDQTWTSWRRLHRRGLTGVQRVSAPVWERSTCFRVYSPSLVPGPLQIAPYVHALLEQVSAQVDGEPNGIDTAVRTRLDKQAIVHDGRRRFAVLLEEGALRSRIAPPDVMTAQLRHLLTATRWPTVSLGVIPADADRSRMTIVEMFFLFDDSQVSVELVSGWLHITAPTEIADYARTFAELAKVAVYGDPARRIITDALRTF